MSSFCESGVCEKVKPHPDSFDVLVAERIGDSAQGVHVRCKPYLTSRTLNCKERWRGRSLCDVFLTEFGLDFEYCQNACNCGSILVNGKSGLSADVPLRNGDVITHSWTAHEPEIFLDHLPHIVWREGNVVGVVKSAGLPTSPQGLYFKTNLVSILKSHLDVTYVQPINRLDRNVCGLVILSLSTDTCVRVERKVYIAKVSTRSVIVEPIECRAKLRLRKHQENDVLRTEIDEEDGSECLTLFRPISSDGSFVECQPVTGRTHQIRAHLALALGCPIVGDVTYSSTSRTNFPPRQSDRYQSDRICLFSYCYWVRVNGKSVVKVSCPTPFFPAWLPPETVADVLTRDDPRGGDSHLE